jgi:hypothetical protein
MKQRSLGIAGQLERRRLLAGAAGAALMLAVAEFHAPADFAKLREKVLINATGFGARALFHT